MTPICFQRKFSDTSRISTPSIRTLPSTTSPKRLIRLTIVVLPAPVGPTRLRSTVNYGKAEYSPAAGVSVQNKTTLSNRTSLLNWRYSQQHFPHLLYLVSHHEIQICLVRAMATNTSNYKNYNRLFKGRLNRWQRHGTGGATKDHHRPKI